VSEKFEVVLAVITRERITVKGTDAKGRSVSQVWKTDRQSLETAVKLLADIGGEVVGE
jgi:hypothetical protein